MWSGRPRPLPLTLFFGMDLAQRGPGALKAPGRAPASAAPPIAPRTRASAPEVRCLYPSSPAHPLSFRHASEANEEESAFYRDHRKLTRHSDCAARESHSSFGRVTTRMNRTPSEILLVPVTHPICVPCRCLRYRHTKLRQSPIAIRVHNHAGKILCLLRGESCLWRKNTFLNGSLAEIY